MNMKKIFVLVVAMAMLLSVAACSSAGNKSESQAATAQSATVAPATQAPTAAPATQAATTAVESGTGLSENASASPALKEVAGKWKLSYYQYADGSTQEARNTVQYIFNADGTFTAVIGEIIAPGTYTFDGNKLAFKADESDEVGEYMYDSENDQLYETIDDGSKAVVVRDTDSDTGVEQGD